MYSPNLRELAEAVDEQRVHIVWENASGFRRDGELDLVYSDGTIGVVEDETGESHNVNPDSVLDTWVV